MTDFPSVTTPDPDVAAQARARQDTLTKPPGSLGRLEGAVGMGGGVPGGMPTAAVPAGAGGGVRG